MMTVSATLNFYGWLWLGTDALGGTSLPQMAHPNQQIVGNGDPQGDTAYFCLSAQTDLLHPVATAGLGIGQLDQTALFAGVFGCLGAHALPPGSHRWGVTRQRHIAVSALVFGLWDRTKNADALLVQGCNSRQLDKASVYQPVVRQFAGAF